MGPNLGPVTFSANPGTLGPQSRPPDPARKRKPAEPGAVAKTPLRKGHYEHDPTDHGASTDPLSRAADDRNRREQGAAYRRCLGDLRPRQRCSSWRGALSGARRATDISRP